MLRRAGEWSLLAAMSVALGLGVAWLEHTFAIPKNVVAWFWIVLMTTALGFAAWTAWGYYRAVRDEDEWE
jgi:ammonia channel protein AmtB